MAGAKGFEPLHDGIKTRCLTAWLRPNNFYNHKYSCYPRIVKKNFALSQKFFIRRLVTPQIITLNPTFQAFRSNFAHGKFAFN
jgi:hypothetical protein